MKPDRRLDKEAAKLAEQLKGRQPVDPGEVTLTSVDLNRGVITAADGSMYGAYTWPNHAFDDYEFHTAIIFDIAGRQEITRIHGPAANTETPTALADCAEAVERELPAKLSRYLYEQANTFTSNLGKHGTVVAVLERDGLLNARLIRNEDMVTLARMSIEGVGVPLPDRQPADTTVSAAKPEIGALSDSSRLPVPGVSIDGPTQGI